VFHGSIPETKDEVPNYFPSAVADQTSRETTARREAMANKSASRRAPANWKV